MKTRSRSRWDVELRPGEDHGPPLVIAIQAFVIVLGSLALGWSPNFDVVVAIPALVLATCAFPSLGLVDGRPMRAEITLAVADAGFILLMLVSGMVIPVSKLPGAMRTACAAAGTRAWVVLAVWAVVRPVLAAMFFRWEKSLGGDLLLRDKRRGE